MLVSTVQRSGVPCAIQQVLISYLFYTYWCIYVNSNLPIHPTTPFPRSVSIRLFSTSVSLFLPCKSVHLYHFSRFHVYTLMYNICFSPSDLLHSVWQSLGPSTSLQMTQFRSFLWLSNIPLYVCTTSSLSTRLSMGILLLPWSGGTALIVKSIFLFVMNKSLFGIIPWYLWAS